MSARPYLQVNANLRDVLTGNFDAMRSLAGKVEHAFESAAAAAAAAATSIEGAAPLPGWEPLRALLAAAVVAADAFESGALVASAVTTAGASSGLLAAAEVEAKIAAAAEVEARIADGAERFSIAVESGVAAALVWAQNVKAAADGPERKKTPGTAAKDSDAMEEDDDEEEEEDELPMMVGTEDALSGALGTKRLAKAGRAWQILPVSQVFFFTQFEFLQFFRWHVKSVAREDTAQIGTSDLFVGRTSGSGCGDTSCQPMPLTRTPGSHFLPAMSQTCAQRSARLMVNEDFLINPKTLLNTPVDSISDHTL
jgi:hypothetical protein